MQQQVQGVFKKLLKRVNGNAGQVQKAAPLAGFWSLLLGDDVWWTEWSQELADVLSGGLVRTAAQGRKTVERSTGLRLDWDLVLPGVMQWAENHAAELAVQLTDDMRRKIGGVVQRGLAEGWGMSQVRDEIVGQTGLKGWRAERIARTEVIRAHTQGAVQGYALNITNVRGLRWLSGQARACRLCKELDGKVVAMGQRFYTDRYGFGDGLPPRHPNCRCAIAPVLLNGEGARRRGLREEDRRNSVHELTDQATWTEIDGVKVTGERRRHWRLRHAGQMDVDRAEGMLEELIRNPVARKESRRTVLHVMEWSKNAYLVAPVVNQEIITLTLKNKNAVEKLPDVN